MISDLVGVFILFPTVPNDDQWDRRNSESEAVSYTHLDVYKRQVWAGEL